ncbi:MAG: hypothetical protein R3F38_14625 [Gammaproteobacteria bacterium]
MVIPLALGLLDSNGRDLALQLQNDNGRLQDGVVAITAASETWCLPAQ